MSLTPGTRVGPYEVTAQLGVGGMGEVYRARDSKLQRDVAIKVLPEAVAQDADRLARFEREARTLAALNHPNIAHIYGLEDADGVKALVMELVEGPTLAEEIERRAGPSGPAGLPMDDALPIAKQIAEALEAAHEQGIIHRDLKPANVKVRPDGTVKVLDFGLAKAMDQAAGLSAGASQSPTITTPAMTQAGMILGTAAYMSPEQARGKLVDRRADLWAFGCVLYEMLAGRRPFDGEDVAVTLGAVIHKEPDWQILPAATPATIRRLLRRCLTKDPKSRLADASTARLEIGDALAPLPTDAPAIAVSAGSARTPRQRSPTTWLVAGAIVPALALVVVLLLWAPWRGASPPASLRLSADLGTDASLMVNQGAAVVLSPDGQTLAFVGQPSLGATPRLYVRRLEQLQATLLDGTDGATSPFFSPDGRWIAFFAGDKLKKVSVTGGAAVVLCDAPVSRGGSWAEDDSITFSLSAQRTGGSLLRVSSAGGQPAPLTTLGEGEFEQRFPQVLPGGKAVLYTAGAGSGDASGDIVVQPLPDGERRVLQPNAFYGRYLPSGHLTFVQDGTLFAALFDLDRLEIAGPAVPALELISTNRNGGAQYALSETGTLVYVSGQGDSGSVPISWMDRDGKTTPMRTTAANWRNPAFAPDGQRLALDIFDGRQLDVWVYEWARDTLSRFSFDPDDDTKPVWTSDGSRIVFASRRADGTTLNLYWQRADGTGEVQRLTTGKNPQVPESWHPSGKFLAFTEVVSPNNTELMILPMEGDEASGWKPGTPRVFLESPFLENAAVFSPDGRWLAYNSNESGRPEAFVRPFPGPGGKWQISTEGARYSAWSRTGPELFFSTLGSGQIMMAPYRVDGESFRAEKPRLGTQGRFNLRGGALVRGLVDHGWDLHPSGDRFALAPVTDDTAARQDKVVFVFNFFDELRRIAPPGQR